MCQALSLSDTKAHTQSILYHVSMTEAKSLPFVAAFSNTTLDQRSQWGESSLSTSEQQKHAKTLVKQSSIAGRSDGAISQFCPHHFRRR